MELKQGKVMEVIKFKVVVVVVHTSITTTILRTRSFGSDQTILHLAH